MEKISELLNKKSISTEKLLEILYKYSKNQDKIIDKKYQYYITIIFEFEHFSIEYLEGISQSGKKIVKFLDREENQRITKKQILLKIHQYFEKVKNCKNCGNLQSIFYCQIDGTRYFESNGRIMKYLNRKHNQMYEVKDCYNWIFLNVKSEENEK